MNYLFFLAIVTFSLYAMWTGPRNIEVALNSPASIDQQIRRMDQVNLELQTSSRNPASLFDSY